MRRFFLFASAILAFALPALADDITVGTTYIRTVRMFQTGSAAGLTGATLTISASKNGGTAATITPTVTEIGNGLYSLALTATHTNTTGPLDLYITATGADPTNTHDLVKGDSGAETGLAQSASSTTLTLASGSNANDNYWQGNEVVVVSGTGAGQVRAILSYVGSTKVATLARAWIVTPDSTSYYTVLRRQSPVIDTNGRVQVQVGTSAGQINSSSGKVPATLATTDVTGTFSVNTTQLAGQTVTAASGVTFSSTVGTSTYAGGDTSGVTTLLGRLPSSLTISGGNVAANAVQIAGQTANAAAAVTFPAAIGTSTYAGADTAGTTTLLGRLPSTLTVTSGGVTVAAYATGQDPGTLTWAAGTRTLTLYSDSAGVTTLLTRLGTPVNASISADIAAVKTDSGTLLTRIGTPAGASIAADIATRMATFTYTVPPTVTQIRQEMDANSTKLDVAVGTRMATFTYTTPPTPAANAAATWDLATTGHTTSGTFGASTVAAGSAGDPWATPTSTAYGAATFGDLFKTNINATIGSRQATFTYTAPDNTSITAIKAQTDQLGFTGGYVNAQVKAIDTAALTALANAVLNSTIDGSVTIKQVHALQLAIQTGKYIYTPPTTTGGPSTTVYKRQDGTTTIATMTTTYTSDGRFVTGRTFVFANLP